MDYLAKDISAYYVKARPYITDTEVLELFDKVDRNCQIITQLINYQRDEDEYGLRGGMIFFSHYDMEPWYRIVNGVCFESVDYDTFSHVLNCYERYNWMDDQEFIHEEDYSGCVLVPELDYGMAIYAFCILLMTKRSFLSPSDIIWDSSGDEMDDKCYWAKKFENRLLWRDDWYFVAENSWKEAYLNDSEGLTLPEGVGEDEKDLLRQFLGRNVYDAILSPSFLEETLREHPTEVSYRQYKNIEESSKEENLKLYGALRSELQFLHRNIDILSDHFIDRASADGVRLDSKRSLEAKDANKRRIADQFMHLDALDFERTHQLFFYNNLYPDIYSWDQPIICSESMHDYVESCILQEERLRMALAIKVYESSLFEPHRTVEHTGPLQPSRPDELDDMGEYLTRDNCIKGTKAVFVRALVKRNHVPTDDDWKTVFSASWWKERLAPVSKVAISNDDILTLSRKLRWDKFDRRFSYKGVLQTKKQLQKAFSDGDATNKERIKAFKALYLRVMPPEKPPTDTPKTT